MDSDPIVEQVKRLYNLGTEGQQELVRRTVAIFEPMFIAGWRSQMLYDIMLDKGIRTSELNLSMVVALTRTNPKYLNGMDSSLRLKYLKDNKEMIENWEHIEEEYVKEQLIEGIEN